jgi:hypothetical protein
MQPFSILEEIVLVVLVKIIPIFGGLGIIFHCIQSSVNSLDSNHCRDGRPLSESDTGDIRCLAKEDSMTCSCPFGGGT